MAVLLLLKRKGPEKANSASDSGSSWVFRAIVSSQKGVAWYHIVVEETKMTFVEITGKVSKDVF